MAIYNYLCDKCEEKKRKIKSIKEFNPRDTHPCDCGGTLNYELSSNSNSLTYETKDSFKGIDSVKGLDKQLKKRMRDHHDSYELEGKIDKHGMDDAKKFGWDRKIKKI
jgi:hypothetical protein